MGWNPQPGRAGGRQNHRAHAGPGLDGDGDRRDRAMAAAVERFTGQGAGAVTATPDGIDLQGAVLSCGVHPGAGQVSVDAGWFSGYRRVATNEKGVVRSYLSAGEGAVGEQMEADLKVGPSPRTAPGLYHMTAYWDHLTGGGTTWRFW